MNAVCERCKKQGHDTSKCEAYKAFQGIHFITSEYAYQWSACVEDLRDDLTEKVIMSKSRLEAKPIASGVKSDSSS